MNLSGRVSREGRQMSWSPEEKALLGMLVQRQTARQIAVQLGAAEADVRLLVKRLLAKMSARAQT